MTKHEFLVTGITDDGRVFKTTVIERNILNALNRLSGYGDLIEVHLHVGNITDIGQVHKDVECHVEPIGFIKCDKDAYCEISYVSKYTGKTHTITYNKS